VRGTAKGEADVSAFRAEVEQGRVKTLYVFDPGPDGYIGDVSWIIEARRTGRLPLLIVQGVLMTALAQAADIVLPGASWVEKDGAFVNGQGRLQAASRAIAPPGEHRTRLRGTPMVVGFHALAELADEITTPGPGQIRALLIDAGNPVVSGPEGRALDGLLFPRGAVTPHARPASQLPQE